MVITQQSFNSNPLVTVAIPTYRRSELLRRALESIANQTYQQLEVLVVDNASSGTETEDVVAEFRDRIPGLIFEKHATNIGAVSNLLYCLQRAKGPLFMWLADDDELSPSCIEAMVRVFAQYPRAVTAAPHWDHLQEPMKPKRMPMRDFSHDHWLARVLKYSWKANDSFFYGLHRTDVLRKARKVEYVWPNRGVLLNWAYPYLLDMVIAGKIVGVERSDAVWKNHDYTVKNYECPKSTLKDRCRVMVRRINVHAIYAQKIYRRGGLLAVVPVFAVSSCSLAMEFAGMFSSAIVRRAGFLRNKKS